MCSSAELEREIRGVASLLACRCILRSSPMPAVPGPAAASGREPLPGQNEGLPAGARYAAPVAWRGGRQADGEQGQAGQKGQKGQKGQAGFPY